MKDIYIYTQCTAPSSHLPCSPHMLRVGWFYCHNKTEPQNMSSIIDWTICRSVPAVFTNTGPAHLKKPQPGSQDFIWVQLLKPPALRQSLKRNPKNHHGEPTSNERVLKTPVSSSWYATAWCCNGPCPTGQMSMHVLKDLSNFSWPHALENSSCGTIKNRFWTKCGSYNTILSP